MNNVIYVDFRRNQTPLTYPTIQEQGVFLERLRSLWGALSSDRRKMLYYWCHGMSVSEACEMCTYVAQQIPKERALTFEDVSAAIAFAQRSKVVQY